jgi:hypothetical protein
MICVANRHLVAGRNKAGNGALAVDERAGHQLLARDCNVVARIEQDQRRRQSGCRGELRQVHCWPPA